MSMFLMTPSPIRAVFLSLAVATTGALAQQPAKNSDSPQARATGNVDSTQRRSLSSEMSSALKAGISYQPAAAQPEPAPEPERPKNEIIRLPEHVVHGEKPAVFSERSLYTQKNLEQLAIQRYLGLSGTNRLGPRLVAMQMYRDDERARQMADTQRQVDLFRITGDDAGAKSLERDARTTFRRTSEFSPPSSVNKVDFSELPK